MKPDRYYGHYTNHCHILTSNNLRPPISEDGVLHRGLAKDVTHLGTRRDSVHGGRRHELFHLGQECEHVCDEQHGDEEEVCAPETRTRSSVEKEGVVRVPVCVCACGRSVGYAEPCVSRTAAWACGSR